MHIYGSTVHLFCHSAIIYNTTNIQQIMTVAIFRHNSSSSPASRYAPDRSRILSTQDSAMSWMALLGNFNSFLGFGYMRMQTITVSAYGYLCQHNIQTFAKTPQFAKGGKENRFNLRKTGQKREGWNALSNETTARRACERGSNGNGKSTFAKRPENAKVGGKKRLTLRKYGPKCEGWNELSNETTAIRACERDMAIHNMVTISKVTAATAAVLNERRASCKADPSFKTAATYSPTCAVPSAWTGLTSLFGMGRGGTPLL